VNRFSFFKAFSGPVANKRFSVTEIRFPGRLAFHFFRFVVNQNVGGRHGICRLVLFGKVLEASATLINFLWRVAGAAEACNAKAVADVFSRNRAPTQPRTWRPLPPFSYSFWLK